MQFWRRAKQPGGATYQLRNDRGAVGSDHYGLRSDREHSSIWDVQFSVEPYGRGCYCGSVGCVDADAVRPGYTCAVGAWSTDSVDRQHACSYEFFKTDVYVGRSHTDHQSRRIYRDGPVIIGKT